MFKIYLISAINSEGHLQWKVGVSKHPDKRIKELATANPNNLTLEAIYHINDKEIAYKTEKLIHKFLGDFKINGEWFESYALNDEKYENISKTLKIIEENKKWK